MRGALGINNIGLVARVLMLKNNPTFDEEEIVKWQTLQVSALSIASSSGRLLTGTLLSAIQSF